MIKAHLHSILAFGSVQAVVALSQLKKGPTSGMEKGETGRVSMVEI